jgi:hypothetical protein
MSPADWFIRLFCPFLICTWRGSRDFAYHALPLLFFTGVQNVTTLNNCICTEESLGTRLAYIKFGINVKYGMKLKLKYAKKTKQHKTMQIPR